MATVRNTLALPTRALRALGLTGSASLQDARRAHRALAFQLHPDREESGMATQDSKRQQMEQLVIINAAREAIELAARRGSHEGAWTKEARAQWDDSTKRIHLSAMLGCSREVLDAVALGVDPNVPTPAQGAPPIFYAACCDFLGKSNVGHGDEARLRVLEVLASHPRIDLSFKGKHMWAEGRTIWDLVSIGRCPQAAIDSLERGQQAKMAVLCQGRLYENGHGAVQFVE